MFLHLNLHVLLVNVQYGVGVTAKKPYGRRFLSYYIRFIVQNRQFVQITRQNRRADSLECLDKTHNRDAE